VRLTRVIANLEPGGAQLGILRITPALARLGIETRVLAGCATRAGRKLFAEAGVEVEAWRGGHPELQHEPDHEFADWLVPRLTDADVVHAHAFGAWWASALAVPAATPLVASEHGELPTGRIDAMLAALPRVDLVFADDPSTRALFAELGVEADRLRSGAHAIDAREARPRRDLPDPRLVFAGSLHPHDGPDLLLDALMLLRVAMPVLMLGGGPLERRLRRSARRRGLEVQFCGSPPDAARYIAGSAACVVPARRAAWPEAAIQAMWLGVPVIAAAVDGLPLAIGSNRGVLVPPEDPEALAAAITDVLLGNLPVDRAEARAYALRFTPDRVAHAFAREYRGVVEAAAEAA
jgi:glycosyltransferase involved in cell wall biosynthesis